MSTSTMIINVSWPRTRRRPRYLILKSKSYWLLED